MTEKTKKIPWGKILSVILYIFELMMEGCAIYHQINQHLQSTKLITIVYACFAVYVIIRLAAFYFILVKRKTKLVVALIVLAVLVSVAGSHFFRSNQKMNQFNYMIRDSVSLAGDNDNYEVFINAYLGDRNVYVDENSTEESLLSDGNRMITLHAQSFNRIVSGDHYLLDDEQSTAISEDINYSKTRYRGSIDGVSTYLNVFLYTGEDYETCRELVMCKDTNSNLYFIPKAEWEAINEQ